MNSPFTGKPMTYVIKEETVNYRSEQFTVKAHYYYCEDTKEEVTVDAQDTLTILQVRNQYRTKHHIPFQEEIVALRQKYGVKTSEMTDILGFGPNTYKNYEKGEVPNKSNGKLLRLAQNRPTFIQLIKLCSTITDERKKELIRHVYTLPDEEPIVLADAIYEVHPPRVAETPSLKVGYRTFSIPRVAAVVAYLAQQLPLFTTQLNKLLFYADFGHYKREGYSITGIPYKAIQMGPVPIFYKDLYEYLEYAQYIQTEQQVFDNGMVGTRYHASAEPTATILNEAERTTLKMVVQQLGQLSTSALIQKSHEEQAWQAHQADRSIITYDHAYYLKHL